MNNTLEVRNLTKVYSDFILDNLNFSLPKGTITGLIGENGSGKTTLIKSLLNLVNKKADSVLFWNQELEDKILEVKEDIGVVFDEINFNNNLTPKQIGTICRVGYSNWNQKFYENFLGKYRIPFNKKINTFSKGMKMKLQCAVALSHNPKLLILDEVTSGLDTIAKDDLEEILFDFIQNEENSVLISSHDINEIDRISDYILFINEGKQVIFDSKEDLYKKFQISKLSKEEFETLDKSNIVAFLENDYNYDLILLNKGSSYNDEFNLEDFLRIYLRGERIEKFAS